MSPALTRLRCAGMDRCETSGVVDWVVLGFYIAGQNAMARASRQQNASPHELGAWCHLRMERNRMKYVVRGRGRDDGHEALPRRNCVLHSGMPRQRYNDRVQSASTASWTPPLRWAYLFSGPDEFPRGAKSSPGGLNVGRLCTKLGNLVQDRRFCLRRSRATTVSTITKVYDALNMIFYGRASLDCAFPLAIPSHRSTQAGSRDVYRSHGCDDAVNRSHPSILWNGVA